MEVTEPGIGKIRSPEKPISPSTGRIGAVRRALLLLGALVLAWGMTYYYHGVLIPIRTRQAQRAGFTSGNWSDLYPRWLGARELLWHGRNPYSLELTVEIQRGFYGRPIDRSRPHDPDDPEAFAYPVYVVFLLVPLLRFPFEAVRSAFTGVLLALTAVSFVLWLRAFNMRVRPWIVLLGLVATMSSYAVVDGLHLQQMTLLVAGLMAGGMAALAGGQFFVAGVLLALASVKPQLMIFVVAFVLLWALNEWQTRKWFVIGFGSMMTALLIGAEAVLPGWLHLWREAAQAYLGYVKPSLLGSLLGKPTAMIAIAFALLVCGALFWSARKEPAGSGQFNFAIVAALLLTLFVIPNAGGAKYNQVLLIPVVLWLFEAGWALTENSGLARATWLVAVNVLLGEWIVAFAVSLAGFVLHHRFEREATWFVAGPELLIFLFPLALALFVLSAAPQIVLAPIKRPSRAAV